MKGVGSELSLRVPFFKMGVTSPSGLPVDCGNAGKVSGGVSAANGKRIKRSSGVGDTGPL